MSQFQQQKFWGGQNDPQKYSRKDEGQNDPQLFNSRKLNILAIIKVRRKNISAEDKPSFVFNERVINECISFS